MNSLNSQKLQMAGLLAGAEGMVKHLRDLPDSRREEVGDINYLEQERMCGRDPCMPMDCRRLRGCHSALALSWVKVDRCSLLAVPE